ncbi:MAG TPA: penicillin-binding transpeptidase domain-containing protein, partial [Actinomycetota bacterium]|nr:penicillin-binding transpeptidase domain-containing protein [Actinomycetota bacterium]
WFAAYAPARDPQYVVAVMLEEGGHGGETAAPIARRIFEGIFDLEQAEITPQDRVD